MASNQEKVRGRIVENAWKYMHYAVIAGLIIFALVTTSVVGDLAKGCKNINASMQQTIKNVSGTLPSPAK